MNVVITGVSRGIGLALTLEALKKDCYVFGVARNPEESPELAQLKNKYPKLKIIQTDLSLDNASEIIGQALKDVKQIDLLINNAGIYENGTDKNSFVKSFTVNSYVPYMMTQVCLSKLQAATNPKLVHITSLMGSIEDNTSGGSYAYRSSKTALNMIHKCLTMDHPWLTSMVIHPGWVETRMGGANAPTSIDESAHGIWKEIEILTPEKSGVFKDFKGKTLPW
jgi:NAD(P)-dependent dehydrogenase (short-subunit alcohol dehydrogenase family)